MYVGHWAPAIGSDGRVTPVKTSKVDTRPMLPNSMSVLSRSPTMTVRLRSSPSVATSRSSNSWLGLPTTKSGSRPDATLRSATRLLEWVRGLDVS